MSDDQPRPPQRYSRFSRADTLPLQAPEEPSLEEIAARALNRTSPASTHTPRSESYGRQPPPPPMGDLDEFVPDPQRVFAEPRSKAPPTREAAADPRPAPPPVSRRIAGLQHDRRAEEAKPRAPATDIVPELVGGIPQPAAAVQEMAGPAHLAARMLREAPPPEPEKAAERAKPAKPAKTKAPKEKRQGPGAGRRALTHVRAKALPALTRAASRSALWVAHNLRRRELRKRYGEALVFAHNRVLDRRLEQLFFVPTLQSACIAPVPDRAILYDGPVPGTVFDWAMAFLPEDLREYAFVDFRAGHGRPMLLAARHNFDRIIGFEFDEQRFDDLQMNIAHYPRSLMTCRNIDCYRGDLDGITIPDQPSVLYFQAAWREDMIPGVMDYVRETYRQSPRRLYVVLENADESMVLAEDDIFHRLEPALPEWVKLRLLSPMEFQIYCTTD